MTNLDPSPSRMSSPTSPAEIGGLSEYAVACSRRRYQPASAVGRPLFSRICYRLSVSTGRPGIPALRRHCG